MCEMVTLTQSRADGSCCLQDFLLDFVLDLHDPDSPRRLMWAATPPPHKLRHLLNFPQQYLPLLQHNELVSTPASSYSRTP